MKIEANLYKKTSRTSKVNMIGEVIHEDEKEEENGDNSTRNLPIKDLYKRAVSNEDEIQK